LLYDHRSLISDKLHSAAVLAFCYGYKQRKLAFAIDSIDGAVDRGNDVFCGVHVLISGYSPST
jgi:hypothetical protein